VGGIRVEAKRFAPGSELGWHRHHGAYVCVLLRGDAHEEVVSEQHELDRLDGTLRPPGVPHRARFGRSGAEVVSFEVAPERLQSLDEDGHRSVVRRRSAVFSTIGRRAAVELRQTDDSSALVLEGLVLELLGEILRRQPAAAERMPAWLRRVRDRLHDEADRRLTHADLAGEAGVHPVHLAQSFRRFFGQSPTGYHRRLRLERAARRLATTDDTLAEIALAAGYCDQAHFSNAFKQAFGLPPGAWRRSSLP